MVLWLVLLSVVWWWGGSSSAALRLWVFTLCGCWGCSVACPAVLLSVAVFAGGGCLWSAGVCSSGVRLCVGLGCCFLSCVAAVGGLLLCLLRVVFVAVGGWLVGAGVRLRNQAGGFSCWCWLRCLLCRWCWWCSCCPAVGCDPLVWVAAVNGCGFCWLRLSVFVFNFVFVFLFHFVFFILI